MVALRLFGTLDLRGSDGRPVQALLQQPRRVALLVYLSVTRPAGFRRRDQLLPLFWPELDEGRGRAALSQALHILRRTLGADAIRTRGTEEVAVDPERLDLDAERFERACDAGEWEAAAALYQGEFLPGFHLSEAPGFERWLEDTRGRLAGRMRAAFDHLATGAAEQGDLAGAIRWARRALEHGPLDEPALRRLMRLRMEAGDRSGAVREYEEFAERLSRDLELTPSAETLALAGELRFPAAAPAAVSASAPATAPVRAAAPGPAPTPSPVPAVPAAPDTAVAPSSVRWLWGAGAVSLLVLVMAGLNRLPPRRDRVPQVAVFPFTVRGDTSLAYLRDGMVDLLSVKLDALGPMRVVDPGRLFAHLARRPVFGGTEADPVEVAVAARDLEADLFVTGRVVSVGPRIEVSATLYDAGGRRQAVVNETANRTTELPRAVDRLVAGLVATRWTAPAERLQRLAAFATGAPAALRAYLEGERHFREGEYALARDAFREAVAVDSLFAIAHYRLSAAGAWVGDDSAYIGGARRAAALSDRLTERDRRLVRANFAYVNSDFDSAEATYRSLVSEYPDDPEAWYHLGEVLFHTNQFRGRPIEEARAPFLRAEGLTGGSAEALGHLATLSVLSGDGAGADTLERLLITHYPAGEARHMVHRLMRAVAIGDRTERSAGVRALLRAEPSAISIAAFAVLTYTDELATADSLAASLVLPGRPPEFRAQGYRLRFELRLGEGRWAEAREEADRARAMDRSLGEELGAAAEALPWVPLTAGERLAARERLRHWAEAPKQESAPTSRDSAGTALSEELRLYSGVLLDLSAGDTASAALGLQQLARRHPGPRLVENARAALAFRAGDLTGALAAIGDKAPPGRPRLTPGFDFSAERFLRAEILRKLGRHAEALGWYRSFRVIFEPGLRFRGPALLGEAACREALDDLAGAADAYRHFLRLWDASDERFAPVREEARARLAALAGRVLR